MIIIFIIQYYHSNTTEKMLYFKEKTPTDNFTSPKGGKPYTIKKNGSSVNEQYTVGIIESMIERRLIMDKACTIDPFPARHSATFITGTSNWREKDLLWGKFDPGGTVGMLLWVAC